MSKVQKFDCGDGTFVRLNSRQLGALLSMPTTPPQFTSWPTYWALRQRKLIDGAQHNTPTKLTLRGQHIVDQFKDRNVWQNGPKG